MAAARIKAMEAQTSASAPPLTRDEIAAAFAPPGASLKGQSVDTSVEAKLRKAWDSWSGFSNWSVKLQAQAKKDIEALQAAGGCLSWDV